MENVERTQFVVLTGHLDDRPLPEVMRTLRVQRKSGRLQVEYPEAPGSFFFEEGQLVDAQLGSLRGVEALYAALSMRGASFNFNPLVRPPERSIDRQGQKFVQDLIETPRREGLSEIRAVGGPAAAATAPALQPATSALPAAPQHALVRLEPEAAAELTAPLEARLTAVEAAIVHASRRFSRERLIYMVVIGFLFGLTGFTALQAFIDLRRRASAPTATQGRPVAPQREAAGATSATNGATNATNNTTGATNGATGATNNLVNATAGAAGANASGSPSAADHAARQEQTARPDQTARQEQAAVAKRSERAARQSQAGVVAPAREARGESADASSASGGYVVHVLMEVKGGRVTEARVLNPRPGAEAYEALALRMARQRRYPDNFTGGDTWKIRVKP